jgi:hypothetical protein
MKTVEFKTRLNQSRIVRVEQRLNGCRRIWNMVLEILEENHNQQQISGEGTLRHTFQGS